MPAIEGEGRQFRDLVQPLGGDTDIRFARNQLLGNLDRAALVQREVHARVVGLEPLDDLRQRVTSLGMGGGDHEVAGLPAGKLVGDAAQVLGIEQNAVDHLGQFLARLGQPEQTLATAHEDLDAEFVLEILDVLADAGLRGVQGGRHFGQVEVLAQRLADDAQLLEVHGGSSGCPGVILENADTARA
jgi:hypothetical protein